MGSHRGRAQFIAQFNAGEPRVFSHGTDIVLVNTLARRSPWFHVLDEAGVRGVLARVAHWVEPAMLFGSPIDAADALPPIHVVRDLLAHADKPLLRVSQIVSAPTFTAQGELIQAPGFHEASGLYYAPPSGFELPEPVPPRPLEEDVERALRWWLGELLADFPFVADADRAHAVQPVQRDRQADAARPPRPGSDMSAVYAFVDAVHPPLECERLRQLQDLGVDPYTCSPGASRLLLGRESPTPATAELVVRDLRLQGQDADRIGAVLAICGVRIEQAELEQLIAAADREYAHLKLNSVAAAASPALPTGGLMFGPDPLRAPPPPP
jgi:hypothetical protein